MEYVASKNQIIYTAYYSEKNSALSAIYLPFSTQDRDWFQLDVVAFQSFHVLYLAVTALAQFPYKIVLQNEWLK